MMRSASPAPPAGETPETSTAVFCRGVTKTYGEGSTRVTALRGIDLEVRPGELLMLVGPSGCGKTTLISVIAGILEQDEGECRVFGRDVKSLSPAEKSRYRGKMVGFVFQSFNLVPTLTACENASLPLLIAGLPRREAYGRTREILDRVGLHGRETALPLELSGGQQQRVAIARALVHEPRLIVCDEPTSSLDHETGHKVMEMLRQVAVHRTRSLVIVTHDARIFSFADRIARMDDGKILEVSEPSASRESA